MNICLFELYGSVFPLSESVQHTVQKKGTPQTKFFYNFKSVSALLC